MSELETLLSNDNSVDLQLTEMRNSETVAPEPVQQRQVEEAAKPVTGENTDADKSEQVSESQDQKETSAGDEEYKPEEYQHNKNYKAAMEAERREKAELKRQFQSTREENEKLKQLYEKILKSAEQQEQERAPSFDDDPIEALKYKAEQTEKTLAQINAEREHQMKQLQQQQVMQKFMGDYNAKVNEFAQTTPDFSDAYKYALEARLNEYKAVGYDDNEAKAMVIEDEMAIVTKAFQRGENPARMIYELAKTRGYTKSIPQTTQTNNAEKMETLQRGIAASKSVNAAGSKPAQLTIEAINAMSDDEFDSVDWSKVLKMG